MNTEKLFHEHYNSLVFFSWKYTNDHSASEDIVQDVFIKLKDVNHVNEKDLLFLSVRNATLNYLKRTKSLRKTHSIYEELKDTTIESELIHSNILMTLSKYLEELSSLDRRLLRGHYFENKEYKELAIQEGKTQANIKSLVRHARVRLKNLIKTGKYVDKSDIWRADWC